MDFNALMNTGAYDFLRDNPRLGDNVILLGVSGSYGYGTNREGSDVDFRGVTLNLPSDLIGLTSFEQFEDRATDTVIYSFNKLVKLLLNCNPHALELLGIEEDRYLVKTELGQELLDHKGLFITKRAAVSFGRYASSQVRRLHNAVARGDVPQPQKEQHIMSSVARALEDFNGKHGGGAVRAMRLYMDSAQTEGREAEIFVDVDAQHYPLREFGDLTNSIAMVIKEYDKVGQHGRGKDDNHLSKHAMHLVRLFMTGIDILERGEIRTRRPDEDLVLLRSIREGDYLHDGVLMPEFYEVADEYASRFAEAERNSTLPEEPDMQAVGRFVESVNRRVVTGF